MAHSCVSLMELVMTERTSKALQYEVLDALIRELQDSEVKPQVIAAAVSYLKAFPPEETPVRDQLTEAEQQMVDQYSSKIAQLHRATTAN